MRFLAFVNDSFKNAVRPGDPWSRDNDHAALARRSAERYVQDERVLTAIELHDELFWVWNNGGEDVGPVLDQIPDCELYLRFGGRDAARGGKAPPLLGGIGHASAERGYGRPPPQMPPPGPATEAGTATVYI